MKGSVSMEEKKNEIILFENQGVKLEVNLKDETVWLNRQQLAKLFDRDVKTIGKHINNALSEELKNVPTVAKIATVQKEGQREVTREIEYYNLDMILSVGYRVKSDKGVIFRKWATQILKDYMLKGYAVNQKRLEYLEKTIKLIDIANRMDERLEGNDAKEIYKSVEEKGANFLYLIVKNHVFADGNKRIAATLFIYFLNFYGILYKNGEQTIDNNTLAALTLLIAESNPKEKDVIIDLVMNFLNN